MKISSHLFDAYLKCPMKCWLRSHGESDTGNAYADWVRTRKESYRSDGIERLLENMPDGEFAIAPPAAENPKAVKWRLAVDFLAQVSSSVESGNISMPDSTGVRAVGESADERSSSQLQSEMSILESRLHAVERLASNDRGKPVQFIPIRFICANKITKDDKLLLAFDQLVLSKVLGREIGIGKIIHGADHAILNVKTPAMGAEVRKRVGKLSALLSSPSAPDLVLCRHCGECEFHSQCRQKAMEKDDLSLLTKMTEKERKKYRSKGIFTVTQLSYAFRPRRRPKRMRSQPEKYHHSLKALAIREKKIHIVGSPELKIDGTPVYLDVEALPDRDFYYLIGLRIANHDSVVQHSLWASGLEDEKEIWREFITLMEQVEKPVFICYGSFERAFLRTMYDRYGGPGKESVVGKSILSLVNLLSFIYGKIYFPTFSNGLKEIAAFLGFEWSEKSASGLQTIAWRENWEICRDSAQKHRLIQYNSDDCKALELVTRSVLELRKSQSESETMSRHGVVDTTSLKREHPYGFKRNTFFFPELDAINKSAYWDYQRERVYARSNQRLHIALKRRQCTAKRIPPNKYILCARPERCPLCESLDLCKHVRCKKVVYDLKFTGSGVKRWIVFFDFHRYICNGCGRTFNPTEREWTGSRYGSNLTSYIVYQTIELRLSTQSIAHSMTKIFGLPLNSGMITYTKERAAETYGSTYEVLMKKLQMGNLIHADETKISVGGKDAFVWVFANMEEVVYMYAETREGDLVQTFLRNFKGVLISDFYTAYDGIECPQQKCLIHLIRDLNDALYKNSYDEDLKEIARRFTELLKPIVDTIDRFGLTNRFLRKHLRPVERFYEDLTDMDPESEAAQKFKERFAKYKDELFTFLKYDNVPWNNNNAEHAIKAFAMLRHVIKGVTSEKGLPAYLVLLSICETCKYKGLDFLDFLRSGAKDIDAFAATQQKRKRTPADPHSANHPVEQGQQLKRLIPSRKEAAGRHRARPQTATSGGVRATNGSLGRIEPKAVRGGDDVIVELESFRCSHAQTNPALPLVYTRQIFLRVVAYAEQQRACGESLRDISLRLGIPHSTLRRWCHPGHLRSPATPSSETASDMRAE